MTVPSHHSAAELAGALLDTISCGVILVGPGGEIQAINQRGCDLLQVSCDSVIGKRVDMLPLRTPVYKVLSENCRDEPVEMSVNGMVLSVCSRECRGPAGVFGEMFELRDMTAERRERRQREEFVAMMTHDLKSPLTVMMGYIQAIRSELSDAEESMTGFCVAEVERSAHRLLGMIEDVLDAYRLEVGLLQINKGFCDLRRLLIGCAADYSREAEAQGLDFSWSVDERIPPMKLDAKQLSRVFGNLLGNAIKFTPRPGTVSFSAELQDRQVVIAVRDTGIGIPPADRERIFTKYFRASGARGFQGTGLGLTITKAIVEAHEGTIAVSANTVKGSCFEVSLPLSSKDVTTPAKDSSSTAETRTTLGS